MAWGSWRVHQTKPVHFQGKASDCTVTGKANFCVSGFSDVLRTKKGYNNHLAHDAIMFAFILVRPIIRVVLVPSAGGITPEQWRRDATVCPPNWPTEYSLLRGWYMNDNLFEFAATQYAKVGRRHITPILCRSSRRTSRRRDGGT